MVLARLAPKYIGGSEKAENAWIINATYAGLGVRSSSIKEMCLTALFNKLHVMSAVGCFLCTAETTVAVLYLRTWQTPTRFGRASPAERSVSHSSYSQCRITYVKCSDKGANEMNFPALGSGFERSPQAGGRPWRLWFIRTFHCKLKEFRSR